MCYVGTKEKGQEFLAAISSWTGDTCLLNEVDEKSFLHQQDSVAQVLRGKREVLYVYIAHAALTKSLQADVNGLFARLSSPRYRMMWFMTRLSNSQTRRLGAVRILRQSLYRALFIYSF